MEAPRRWTTRRGWRATLADVLEFARKRQVPTIAAGLAYHALNALVPTVILLLLGLSVAGGFASVTPAIARLTSVDPGVVKSVARQVTNATSGRVRAAVVAGVIFLWSTGRLFQALQDSFAEVYGAESYDSWSQKLGGIALSFGIILLGLVGMVVLGAWLSNVVEGPAWRLFATLLLFVGLSVLFLPLYFLLPNVHISVREALPGAVFAAIGWTASGLFFRLYASISSSVQFYGVLGGLVLFMTWVYLGGLVLLLGVVLNAVVADRLDVTDEF